jgi:hypothetical protein
LLAWQEFQGAAEHFRLPKASRRSQKRSALIRTASRDDGVAWLAPAQRSSCVAWRRLAAQRCNLLRREGV